MADSFEIDPWEMKAGVLSNASKQARKPPVRKQFAREVLTLMKQALEHDALTVAEQMSKLALAEGSKLRDKEIISQAREGAKQVEQAVKTFAQVEAALATLKEKPDDPEANLRVGRCVVFRPKRNGSTRAALAARRSGRLETTWRGWATMRGLVATRAGQRTRWAGRSRMPGGCTTCMGTSWSGAWIGMPRTSTGNPRV